MKFEMHRDQEVAGNELVVLHICGELDIDCAPALQEAVRPLLDQGCLHLLLEIDGLRHLDSFSLGTFLGLRQRLRASNGSMSLVCHVPTVRRLFHITNLERVFEFYDSVAAFVTAKGGHFNGPAAEGTGAS